MATTKLVQQTERSNQACQGEPATASIVDGIRVATDEPVEQGDGVCRGTRASAFDGNDDAAQHAGNDARVRREPLRHAGEAHRDSSAASPRHGCGGIATAVRPRTPATSVAYPPALVPLHV
jgi:hypothetical protein